VLILLPPSESKAVVRRGKPLDPERLSFPSLGPTREAVLDALVEVSAEPDAVRRLGVPPTLEDVVRRNTGLRAQPTAAAEAVYTGVLYDALSPATLSPAGRRRARAWIVVVSALWGAVRLGDRIPPYRLNMCGRLPGLDHLPQVWRPVLDEVLPEAARRGLVVDCRSAEYATAWRPAGAVAERTLVVKVFRDVAGGRAAVSHNAKHTRGLVARHLVEAGLDPRRPADLADALGVAFQVDLRPPARAGRVWELHVREPGG
jgi:uncharacterized protein